MKLFYDFTYDRFVGRGSGIQVVNFPSKYLVGLQESKLSMIMILENMSLGQNRSSSPDDVSTS